MLSFGSGGCGPLTKRLGYKGCFRQQIVRGEQTCRLGPKDDVWRSGGPSNAANPMLPVSIDLLCRLYGDAPRNVCCAFSGQSPIAYIKRCHMGPWRTRCCGGHRRSAPDGARAGYAGGGGGRCTDRCSPTNIWMIWDIVGRLPPKLASLTATLSVLGTTDGLKGCAARTGKPASALDPAAARSARGNGAVSLRPRPK